MSTTEASLNDSEFNKFRKLIYDIAGISLSDRKRELVKSRLARRLRAHNLESYAEYYDLLCDSQQSQTEIEHFTNALTTNKTEFFREAHHFEYLRNEFFPMLRQATLSGRDKKLRIWCAASSTGQEPYTLAITMMEYFGSQTDWDVRLLASDIDTQVLATATAGIYPESEMDGLTTGLRSKYFAREARGADPTWRAKDELKQLITFRQLNLIHSSWPIHTQFDAIFCRNVMIYFDQVTQKRLVDRFAEYLHPGGLLVIGHSESLFSITDQFDSLGDTIYKIKPSAVSQRRSVQSMPGSATGPLPKDQPAIQPAFKPAVKPAAKQISQSATRPTSATRTPTTRLTNSTSTLQHVARVPNSSPAEPEMLTTKVLVVGEYEASREECMLQTVLGSCVAACLFDPSQQLGGINHFMLPEGTDSDKVCATFGVHAMELLINAIMKLGGSRRHLIAKIFGGAKVVENFDHSGDVGKRNVEFVKKFLSTENIPIAAEHVLGDKGRRIKFIPTTGKVFVSLLDRATSISTDKDERAGGRIIWETSQSATQRSVTLFS